MEACRFRNALHNVGGKMNNQGLKEKIASRIREGLKKDFNKLYVKEFTTTWEIERACREIELDIMSLDNTIQTILSFWQETECPK